MNLGLTKDFNDKVEGLLKNCLARGIEMRPTEGLRNPVVQAKYWKQSRLQSEIDSKINELLDLNCSFLATVIRISDYSKGPKITNAIPGNSWHQWGEALDCGWVVDGKFLWSLSHKINGLNGFEVYAEEAVKLNLEPGLLWQSIKDGPHVQLRDISSPAQVYSLQEINFVMEKRFSYLIAL
ncbi:MAG TPA: M15 family metallopeptidase [Cyclobacteriaceae bacterium]|nr:M15 family metallopeptidase [Cyclobacteriaceae bacterium]